MARKKATKRADEMLVTEDEKTDLSSVDNEDVEETERQAAEVVDEETEMPATCVNEGPLLTSVIIKTYSGQLLNGLFEGEGFLEFTDGHVYRGFFHQGLMHGDGFYKWNDGVTYQGDFLLNRITGKGTYIYLDGSTYEGEVLNGKRHGYGHYNWKAQRKCYTGYWFKGKKHGKGCMQFDEESLSFYHGDWQCDLPHGWGLQRYISNNIYEGFWFQNKPNVEGVMKWFVKGRPKDMEIYTGHWANGIQQGYGENVWITYRALNSQFNAQNLYKGNFVNGKRHGKGTFYYADGSKYKGEWFEDMKHGFAKFTQRTGEIYEGMFENNGLSTNILVKGLPALVSDQDCKSPFKEFRTKSVDRNFMVDVSTLLKGYHDVNPERELKQVSKNVWRHIAYLKKIYLFYASLGQEAAIDNVYLMNNLQFWRFLKDSNLHHYGITLMQMDRLLGKKKTTTDMHNPFGKLLLREFIANLVILAFKSFASRYEEAKANLKYNCLLLDWCFSQLLRNNIHPNNFNVKGHIFNEVRKALNIMEHIEEVYKIYSTICKPRKLSPHDPSMKMRDCLVLLKDLNLINENLTSKVAIGVLAEDDPNVIVDGHYNVELEMTYLEFVEALVGFAEIYVTESVVEAMTQPIDTLTSQSRTLKTVSQQIMSPVVSTNVSTISLQHTLKRADTMEEKTPEHDDRIISTSAFSQFDSFLETSESKKTINEIEAEVEVEELDQATKKYNFWTHQIHIFFIEKFIRPVKNLLNIRQIVNKMVKEELQNVKMIQKQKAATEHWYLLCSEIIPPSSSQDHHIEENIHIFDEFGDEMKSNSVTVINDGQ